MRRNPVGYQAYLLEDDACDGFWGNLTRLASTTLEQAVVRTTRALFQRRDADDAVLEDAFAPQHGRLKPYGTLTRSASPVREAAQGPDSLPAAPETHPVARLASRISPARPQVSPDALAEETGDTTSRPDDPLQALYPDKITSFFSARDDRALKSDRRLSEGSRQGEEALEAERMDVIEEDPFLAHVARDLIVLERQNARARMTMAMAGIKTRRPLRVESQDVCDTGGVALPAPHTVESPMTAPFREVSPRRQADEPPAFAPRPRVPHRTPSPRDRDQAQLLLEHNKFLSQSIHRLAEGYFNPETP